MTSKKTPAKKAAPRKAAPSKATAQKKTPAKKASTKKAAVPQNEPTKAATPAPKVSLLRRIGAWVKS